MVEFNVAAVLFIVLSVWFVSEAISAEVRGWPDAVVLKAAATVGGTPAAFTAGVGCTPTDVRRRTIAISAAVGVGRLNLLPS